MADTLLGNLVWKITGDTKDFDKNIGASEKKTTGFSGKAVLAAGAIAGATAVALTKIVDFVKDSVKVSVAAQEQISKYGVVFGDLGSGAEDSAKKFADSFDLASSSAKAMLSNTGNLLQGMGATTEESLNLSLQVNTLAGDLASFTNNEGGAKAASDALTKALLGERESMKTLGIAILDSDVNLRVAKNGKEEYTGTALKMAKAEATLQLITEQSKNAIGDYARTQDSAANAQKRAEESTIKLQVAIGKALNPAVILSANLWDRIAGSLANVITRQGELKEINIDVANGAKTTSTDIGVLSEQYKKLSIDANALKQSGREESDIYKQIKAQMDFIEGERIRLKYIAENKKAKLEATNIINEADKKIEAKRVESLEIVKGLLKDQRTEYQKLSENIIKLEGIKNLSGEDEKNRLAAISGLKAEQAEITAKQQEDESIALDEALQKKQDGWDTEFEELEKINKKKQDDADADKKADAEKLERVATYFGNASAVLSALGSLSANLAAQEIAQLDAQLQAELTAAGVADATAVQSAQLALDKLDENATETERIDAEKALTKALIEEKYAKKRAKLEYDAALISWGLQLAIATATGAQAIIGAIAAPPFFPLNAGSVALAASIAALQVGAVSAARPVAKFAQGGIVPGSSYSGDRVLIAANSGEEVLTANDPRHRNNSGGANVTLQVGTLIADKAGLRELNRQLSKVGAIEKARRG